MKHFAAFEFGCRTNRKLHFLLSSQRHTGTVYTSPTPREPLPIPRHPFHGSAHEIRDVFDLQPLWFMCAHVHVRLRVHVHACACVGPCAYVPVSPAFFVALSCALSQIQSECLWNTRTTLMLTCLATYSLSTSACSMLWASHVYEIC